MPIDVIHPTVYADAAAAHRRIRWTPESADLHVNLVDLRAGEEIGEHVNTALDVVLTCLGGGGTLLAGGERIEMGPGSVAMIPRGARRGVIAGAEGMRYTTCHRKRGGLMPTVPPSRRS